MDLKTLAELIAKYKDLLLKNPEVFVVVFVLGGATVWFLIRSRVGNAKSEIQSHKAQIEALEQRIELQKERAGHYQESALTPE